jgi:hypothetical protein
MIPVYGDRTSTLAHGLSRLNWGTIDAVFETAGLSWRPEIVEYGKFTSLHAQLEDRSSTELDRLEAAISAFDQASPSPDDFRLFISHPSQERALAGDLKLELKKYQIDGFVAHDSIEFDETWQQVIIEHLNVCQALVAIVTPDFAASQWCDQEVGWALGRGVPVMSINAGKAPYGFFGARQALPFRGDSNALAEAIASRLLQIESTGLSMTERLVSSLESVGSYDAASALVELLGHAVHWTPALLRRAERTIAFNDQVRDANRRALPNRLRTILAAAAAAAAA